MSESTRTVQKHNFSGNFWNNEIKNYYQSKLGVQYIQQILQDHNVNLSIKVRSKKSSLPKTRILQDFGEVITSWLLENRYDVLFASLRWAESPFETSEGVDLVGFKKPNYDICYIEAKARTASISSAICCGSDSLAGQLKDSRLSSKLNEWLPIRGSRYSLSIWITELMRRGDIPPDRSIIERILSTNKYLRYGSIIHPKLSKPLNFNRAFNFLDIDCSNYRKCNNNCVNCSTRNPITFMDVELEDFDRDVQDFVNSAMEWCRC